MTNNNLVIIRWENETTKEQGQGLPIDREIAERWIEQMHGVWPHIVHWIEDVKPEKESEPAKTNG